MFTIDENNKIKVIQGDTGIFELALENHMLSAGDKVYFTVKKDYNSQPLIKKVVTEFTDGKAKFILTSSDTNIDANIYLYDVQCSLADGRIDTIIKPSKFQVLGGITND